MKFPIFKKGFSLISADRFGTALRASCQERSSDINSKSLRAFSLKRELISYKAAFSLIELLIVVAIFGLTVTLVTAAFITFDRNQKLRNAALQLKSDLRQAQNKALSGDKGTGGAICPSTATLGGWYIQISTDSTGGNNSKYLLAGDCKTGATDSSFAAKTVFLPGGVTVSTTSLGAIANADIFFRPLSSGVSFHNGDLVPPFFDSSGNLVNQVGAGNALTITLTSGVGGDTYQVVILPSGEINESKP